ncbi:MAG: hypothetical protein ACK4GN_08230 [Runella sp.]
MAANTASILAQHADGVIKDGDLVLHYEFRDGNDAVYDEWKAYFRKHPASSKPTLEIVFSKRATVAVSDGFRYLKSAEFLRDLKPKVGISGVKDDVVESIAALVMTSAPQSPQNIPQRSRRPRVEVGKVLYL